MELEKYLKPSHSNEHLDLLVEYTEAMIVAENKRIDGQKEKIQELRKGRTVDSQEIRNCEDTIAQIQRRIDFHAKEVERLSKMRQEELV